MKLVFCRVLACSCAGHHLSEDLEHSVSRFDVTETW
ncbi:hypothetical protein ACP70R_014479 [Stipagrostis hirtigluma subsp. patula]